MGQQAVPGRVPGLDVHAVEDAGDPVAPFAQHAVESHAHAGRADLTCVGGADRADQVRVDQALPQQVDAALGRLARVEARHRLPEPQPSRLGVADHALVTQVVDRQHRAGPRERGLAGAGRLQVERDQRGMPVVAVHDVRADPQRGAGRQRRPREQQETQVFVRAGAVQPGPVEQGRAIHQQHVRLHGAPPPAQHRVAEAILAEGHLEPVEAVDPADLQASPVEAGVEREEERDLVAALVKCVGQCRGDVAQSARLGMRGQLGGDVADRQAHRGVRNPSWERPCRGPPRPRARHATAGQGACRRKRPACSPACGSRVPCSGGRGRPWRSSAAGPS